MSIPFIRSKGKNTMTCNCDLVIFKKDDNTPIILSLFDYGIKTKKISADFYTNSWQTNLTLEDREDISLKKDIRIYNESFISKSDRQGELTHTIIRKKNIDDIIIDWNNEGLTKCAVNYIRNKLYIPITEEIFNDINNGYLSSELEIYTNNKMYKNLKAYYLSSYWLSEKIKSYKGQSVKQDNFNWDEIETIQDYIYEFINPIKDKISQTIHPLYNSNNIYNGIFEGELKPLNGQVPIIQSAIDVLNQDSFVFIGAEQGCGKTTMGSKINHNYFKQKGNMTYITLIVAPAITLTQWKEEIKKSFSDKVNIIIIKKTEDFIKWTKSNKSKIPTYLIIGKETFKLGYAQEPSYNKSKQLIECKELDDYYKRNPPYQLSDYMYSTRKRMKSVLICPDCGIPLKNPNRTSEDVFFEEKDFKKANKGNYKCTNCGSILWSATYNKTKKTSVIDYIHRKHIKFDSVILDEAHESNNSSSIIGNSTRTLLRNHTKKVIALSGTNNNGYASSLHNLFMALCPNKLIHDDCLDVKDFIHKYGTLQAVTPIKDERRSYYNRGKAEIKDSEFKEIEGINPIVFTKYLSSNYIFATLDDMKDNLPPIYTNYIPIEPLEQQYYGTKNLMEDIKKANCFNAKMYNDSIVKHYLNNPVEWSDIKIQYGDEIKTIYPQNLYIDRLPKEDKLIEIVKQEYSENRKVWIYCDFNSGGNYMNGIPLPKKIKSILENEGLKVFILTTSASTYDRKEIIDKNKDKYDVFICNPRLVNVGINLTFCPTYIFFMPSYRVDIYSQASRRGYRANSTLENRIYHLYYKGTIEEEIIERYQRKLAESNAINGVFNVELENKDKIRTASQFSNKISENI